LNLKILNFIVIAIIIILLLFIGYIIFPFIKPFISYCIWIFSIAYGYGYNPLIIGSEDRIFNSLKKVKKGVFKFVANDSDSVSNINTTPANDNGSYAESKSESDSDNDNDNESKEKES
jgi:hypothetical protein